MIVQCPSCSKRYRVNDANIPASGGKITCPQCSHSFVVYPESDSSQPDPSAHEEPGAKTSVAQRPNMEQLLNSMQQGDQQDDHHQQSGQPQGQPGGEDEVAKTEVMSGSELPDFNNLFGEGGPDDDEGTVEMENPLSGMGGNDPQQPGGPAAEDELKTQQLDSDIVDQSLGHIRDQAESSPPIEQSADPDGMATQVTPPPNVDNIPSPGSQQRASVPDNPTPPPGGSDAGGFGAGAGGGSFDSPSASSPSTPSGPAQGPSGAGPADSSPGSSPSAPGGDQFGASSAGPDSDGPGFDAGASSGDTAAGSGPDPDHDGPWKLKTNFGLTYEFADNDSLRDWLDGRDELDGYELSADDGDSFFPLDDFPQVSGSASGAAAGNAQISSTGKQAPIPGSGPMPASSSPSSPAASGGHGSATDSQSGAMGSGSSTPAPGSAPGTPAPGSGPGTPAPGSGSAAPIASGGHSPFQTASGSEARQPESSGAPAESNNKERIDPNEKFEPPSRDNNVLNMVLWGVFVLLLAMAALLAAELYGAINLFGDDEQQPAAAVVQQEEPAPEQQQPVAQQADEQPTEQVDEVDDVDELIDQARAGIDDGRFEEALEQLQEASSIDPEQITVYDLKADVHDELGDTEQAEESREQARQLREELVE